MKGRVYGERVNSREEDKVSEKEMVVGNNKFEVLREEKEREDKVKRGSGKGNLRRGAQRKKSRFHTVKKRVYFGG